MTNSLTSGEDFIADAERHNEWWGTEGNPLADLDEVVSLRPRSDLHTFLRKIDGERNEGTFSLVYPIYGPTGIGKTTLLLQFIASVLDNETIECTPEGRELEILDDVDPRQICYIPLEESLYHLERSDGAIEKLERVIDYYRSHIALRGEREYLILDDIGALKLDNEDIGNLLELAGDETYLIMSGIVKSQVNVSPKVPESEAEEIKSPFPMLSMKFVDTIIQGTYGDSSLSNTDSELTNRIESNRSGSLDGPSHIKDVRTNLGPNGNPEAVIDSLEKLYFDVFSASERDSLHNAAREYLRKGGLFHRTKDDAVKNELVRSHFLLYLYKELARYESIQQPENLHRISSLAATRAGEELRYTDISDQLDVDRRTVDGYLSALSEGLSVSESHEYSLQRHRRVRLYLRNPHHVVLLSQRQEHYGFKSSEDTRTLNHEFEYKLARTVAFDHAKRLASPVSNWKENNPGVEYCETDAGTVDYVLQSQGFVAPFVLSYHPYAGNAVEVATAFDPSSGKHTEGDGDELRELDYEAPHRFIISDSLPKEILDSESLVVKTDETNICYLPFWLFLLIC